ncbi:MAG: PAS domain S-box protein [Chloroflexi bacterium]|nr:PAS domain S-box protein [Chloroflexota bacterium]
MIRRIKNFLVSPVFTDKEKTRRAQLLYFICWAGIAVLFLVLIPRFTSKADIVSKTSLVLEGLVVVIFILLFFIRRGHVQAASIILVFSSWGAMVYQGWAADGVRDVAVLGQLVVIIVCSLVMGWEIAAGLTFLSILSIWGMAILETRGIFHPIADKAYSIASDLTGIFVLAAMLMYTILKGIRQSVDEVRASEERFRKFFHSSVVAISITNLEDGQFIEANQAFWQISGLDAKTAIGKTAVELGTWGGGQPERDEFVKKLKEKGSIQNVEYDFKHPNGETRNALAFYELMELTGQSNILCMFYDVTEKKKAEQALRESEHRTRALLDAIPDMIFEMDKDGTFLDFIQSKEIGTVVPPEDFLGKKIQDVLPPSVSSPTLFGIERVLNTGQTYAFEYKMESASGPRDFEARIVASGPERVLSIVRDITARKWAEAERETLINQLEIKNAELERFTYTVSHDLKAPLITIKGFVGLLRDDAKENNVERVNKDIQRISDAAEKMQRLLNELLELSRIGRLMNPPEEVQFEALVREAMEIVHGRLTADRVRVEIQSNLPAVYGDRQRLLEVLQNLIDNAAKFMGQQADPLIEVGQSGYEDDKPIFFVRDNGIGIAPQFHDRIFGLFNKLDPKSEGTGVGLALVKRIVETHSGRIWLESEEGRGTTFYFTLPTGPQT